MLKYQPYAPPKYITHSAQRFRLVSSFVQGTLKWLDSASHGSTAGNSGAGGVVCVPCSCWPARMSVLGMAVGAAACAGSVRGVSVGRTPRMTANSAALTEG